jgi:hypothetical protein
MKKWLSIILAAGLLLYPFATFAEDYGSQAAQTKQVPPVAQTLVREGDFAIKLAATLDLGNPTDEAVAVDTLAKAEIAPLNGWLPDYPMTPQILGQLQSSIAKAASEGKLPMTAEEGTRGLYYLASQMNLPTPAGTAKPEGSQSPAEQSNPGVVNNYYYDQGPPIITYYPPPYYYGYLYDWVAYPVFWFGFWFPGFYICHNFTTVVVVDRTAFVNRRAIVSNRIIDPVTRRVARVDPVTRTSTGLVRPETTLRTESGETFRNLAELRHGGGVSRPNVGRPGTSVSRTSRTGGFRSPEARKSASAIYSRSVERMRAGAVREGGMGRNGGRRVVAPGAHERSYNTPSRGGERRYIAPNNSPERSYRSPAMRGSRESVRPFVSSNASAWGSERRFVAPGPSSRQFSGPVTREDGAFMRSYSSGNGWHGRGFSNGNGGTCRGKC